MKILLAKTAMNFVFIASQLEALLQKPFVKSTDNIWIWAFQLPTFVSPFMNNKNTYNANLLRPAQCCCMCCMA